MRKLSILVLALMLVMGLSFGAMAQVVYDSDSTTATLTVSPYATIEFFDNEYYNGLFPAALEGMAGLYVSDGNATKTAANGIWGYDDGPSRLEGTSSGDIVMAYVNQQGLRAMGKVIDPDVKKGKGIFLDDDGNQKPEEYHLNVEWEIILNKDNALTASQAKDIGYNLPYRVSFGKMRQGESAKKIEKEIRRRIIS